MYNNESLIGRLLKTCSISRKDLFITTKVNNPMQGYNNTLRSVEQSLEDLQVDNIDLLLIHWPSKQHFLIRGKP